MGAFGFGGPYLDVRVASRKDRPDQYLGHLVRPVPRWSIHPLQALYEKLKDRSDVQIVTFNIDEEIGDIAPYMNKNKYTFPVLLAKDYMADLVPDSGIPMLWIVDASGKWRWQQTGFGDDAKWESAILEKLDHAKPQ